MRTILAALLMLAPLGACATTGAKECTPEWQAQRKEIAFTGFAQRHSSQLETLRALSNTFVKDDDGKPPSSKGDKTALLQVAFAGVGMIKLAGQFSDETARPIRYDLAKCGPAPTTGMLFADMLRQEKFPPEAAAAVEQLSLWMSFGN